MSTLIRLDALNALVYYCMMKHCLKEGCEKPAVVRGYCRVHYKVWQTKSRVDALRGILEKAELIKKVKPELSEVMDELTKDAKELYREFKD